MVLQFFPFLLILSFAEKNFFQLLVEKEEFALTSFYTWGKLNKSMAQSHELENTEEPEWGLYEFYATYKTPIHAFPPTILPLIIPSPQAEVSSSSL